MSQDEDAIDLFGAVEGVELIQKTPLFSTLGFEDTQRLAQLTRLERFPRGHVVTEQDSLGVALYIVREGEVTVWHRDSSGRRNRVAALGKGELFGEMSLVDNVLVSSDVEASSAEVELVVIPRDGFEMLLESNERLAASVYKAFCTTLSDRLRRTTARLHDDPTPQ